MIRISNMKDNGRFTVEFLRSNGEPFVKIYGCKVIDYSGGQFVSVPSFKGRDDRYVNHAWIDDAIQEQIIEAVKSAQPVQQEMNEPPLPDDDIPF